MKVVLLTTDYNSSANIGIKAFLESSRLKKAEIEVLGLVVADQFNFRPETLKKTVYYFKKLKLLFFLKHIVAEMWKQAKMFLARYLIPRSRRELLGLQEMAQEHGIPFLAARSINDVEVLDFVKAKKPDFLLSCFLLELAKEPLLALSTQGAINVHPALTQQHRGTFTSFWTLLNNWKKGGATVHYMTKNIDDGQVILQKKFFVHPSDTLYSVNKKAAKLGGKLLARALVKLQKKEAKKFPLKKLGKLFTMPKPVDIDRFYAKGRRLMSVKEFFML